METQSYRKYKKCSSGLGPTNPDGCPVDDVFERDNAEAKKDLLLSTMYF